MLIVLCVNLSLMIKFTVATVNKFKRDFTFFFSGILLKVKEVVEYLD